MNSRRSLLFAGFVSLVVWICLPAGAKTLAVDDTPGHAKEWGFRPADGETVQVTPPGFSWRPQKEAARYELQCWRGAAEGEPAYKADGIEFNVHTPAEVFEPGEWRWRFRYYDADGNASGWSQARAFTIEDGVNELPLPAKKELIERIPKSHPRLFVRPEEIPELRRRARADLEKQFDGLVKESEGILQNPPPTEEPPLYPEGMERKGEDWRKVWWGNRTYTIRALNSAAVLGFTRLLGGKEEYGEFARKILMECAEWDPKGATGYRYNDEAGMPYNYYFARTYTFINDLLTEAEREKCREVMRIRGREMYEHLCPRHLWSPYSSHSNRAWHFLGEVGIAFLDEIPEAEDWVWFAANVFTNVYPVWSDADGGWHEGLNYWRSYIGRFTWWADVMRVAMGINAFDKPYFSQVGFYPLYMQPPGTVGGGFGDLNAGQQSSRNRSIMSIFAAQAQNPYWQWYVDAHGGAEGEGGYIGFIRGALPKVPARPPGGLPTSRCFWGTGQAVLNSNLENARDNVEIIFKSSPFGTQSHGYESQNSFLLYAFGERLFIRTGRRDIYGSEHHTNWMWNTKSTNCITINGGGQTRHSAEARGEILEFQTGPVFDYVSGEAAEAYGGAVEEFTRRILFIKPEAVVIFDTLTVKEPSTYEWLLHAPVEMDVRNQHDIRVVNGEAACRADFAWPPGLELSQTNRFDPPPRPRVKLVEYHLTAKTAEKAESQTFITVLRPYKKEGELQGDVSINKIDGGFKLNIPYAEDAATIWLFPEGGEIEMGDGQSHQGEVAAKFEKGEYPKAFFINRRVGRKTSH